MKEKETYMKSESRKKETKEEKLKTNLPARIAF
jgi:hypothetical protein